MVQKGRVLENREILRHNVWEKRERGARGTCNRKPPTLFWYTTDSNCCFGIFSTKHGILM
jgi:hypothetical protein